MAATAALAAKKITPRVFITRVVYKGKLSSMSNFVYTTKPLPDEFTLDLGSLDSDIESVAGDEMVAIPEQNVPAANAYTCGVCKESMSVVLFKNSNHLSMCAPCYERFESLERKRWRRENDLLSDNEGEEEDNALLDHRPPFTFNCIACRAIHTRDQVTRIYPV